MILDGYRVTGRSATPGEWIEIETGEGPAILRGYDPSLIEYESVEEAREAKRAEIHRRAAEETEAVMPAHARERASRDIARGRNPRTRDAVDRLDAIADKAEELEARLDAATTVEEISVVDWDAS